MTYFMCECGKVLTSSQSFNGHKSNCRVHLEATGKWEARQKSRKLGASKVKVKLKNIALKQKESKLARWLATEPKCERCGKLMTEKFGSGRFCSRACANVRLHTEETKDKIRTAAKLSGPILSKTRKQQNEANYLQNPKFCCICNSIIPYTLRERSTCSEACYSKLRADIRMDIIKEQGLTNTFKDTFKYGWYHGIECDSGWELAFVLYHLAQGSNIKRNNKSFSYQFNGAIHHYYPDFIIDNVYYEIKGYKDERFFEKVRQFPVNEKLVVIDASTIDTYINFAVKTYGENFYSLYDLDHPSWMKAN